MQKKTVTPRGYCFNEIEVKIIDMTKEPFLETGVIGKTTHSEEEYISKIFVQPKKDGSHWLILNLKHSNHFVEYHHFKMENLKSTITLMSPKCYMATMDLKDAYYSLSLDKGKRKYLRFAWNNYLFQFTCLPNGLSSAPRILTKLMKPVYSILCCKCFENVEYIDDTYLKRRTFHDCEVNITNVVRLLRGLSLALKMAKTMPISHSVYYLFGFCIKLNWDDCLFNTNKGCKTSIQGSCTALEWRSNMQKVAYTIEHIFMSGIYPVMPWNGFVVKIEKLYKRR